MSFETRTFSMRRSYGFERNAGVRRASTIPGATEGRLRRETIGFPAVRLTRRDARAAGTSARLRLRLVACGFADRRLALRLRRLHRRCGASALRCVDARVADDAFVAARCCVRTRAIARFGCRASARCRWRARCRGARGDRRCPRCGCVCADLGRSRSAVRLGAASRVASCSIVSPRGLAARAAGLGCALLARLPRRALVVARRSCDGPGDESFHRRRARSGA